MAKQDTGFSGLKRLELRPGHFSIFLLSSWHIHGYSPLAYYESQSLNHTGRRPASDRGEPGGEISAVCCDGFRSKRPLRSVSTTAAVLPGTTVKK